jgi:hypothetical protein
MQIIKNKTILFEIFLFLLLFSKYECRKKHHKELNSSSLKLENEHINFIAGLAVGYGLSAEASDELKKCFIEKEEKGHKIINNFLNKISHINYTGKLSEKELGEEEKTECVCFTKKILNFFGKFKDCAPFHETIFGFIKNRLMSLGVKGIAYALGGPLGLLIKSAYDIYKIASEISDFHHTLTSKHRDYLKLGSSVGKIIYYTQNLLMRRRKRRL